MEEITRISNSGCKKTKKMKTAIVEDILAENFSSCRNMYQILSKITQIMPWQIFMRLKKIKDKKKKIKAM